MSRRIDLERAAERLARLLQDDECLLIGGLAVAAHGYLRATEDVDLVVRTPLRKVAERLKAAGVDAVLKRGDPLEGDFPCVKGKLEGVAFDVLPPLVRLDWDQAVVLRLGAVSVRVVDLEGLVRLKLRAQGPQDLLDVAILTLIHPEARAPALDMARTYRVADKLERLLASPRLQVKAAELREAAARPKRRSRRPLRRHG